MSIQTTIKQPCYYHRETKYDVGSKKDDCLFETLKDALPTLLPFAALYRPAVYPLTVAATGLRTIRFGQAFVEELGADKISAKSLRYFGVQTAISGAAFAGTIAAHPLGMMISTGQDLLTESWALVINLKHGKKRAAFENTLHIVNNALYLALFLKGSAGLAVASLALQVLNNLYHSVSELEKGNKLKAAAHFALMGLRCNQLARQIDLVKFPIINDGTVQDTYEWSNYKAIRINNQWYWLEKSQVANWKVGDHIVVQNMGHWQMKFTNESHYFKNVAYI